MTQRQIAHPCDEHPDCTAIGLYSDTLPDGRDFDWQHPEHGHILWLSHAHTDTHPVCRVADGTTVTQDGTDSTGSPQCDACAAYFTDRPPL